MHTRDPVNLNAYICKKYDATCCASAYTHYIGPSDDPTDLWDFTFNLMAVDPNIKLLNLHLAVADPRLEVVDLK